MKAPRSGPLLRQDLALGLAGLAVLIAWEFSGLDLSLIRHWGTPQGFPWSENFWARTVMHDGGRWLGWGLFIGVLFGAVRGAFDLPAARWRAIALTMLACVLTVSWLKSRSLTSCPWSLAEFGGVAHYVPHWAFGVPDGGSGHCFPSGHASTGFAFFAVYFGMRQRHPRGARVALALTVGFGVLFGGTQMLRGAHYASHTLWTAWVCWMLSAAAFHLSWGRRDLRPEAEPLLH